MDNAYALSFLPDIFAPAAIGITENDEIIYDFSKMAALCMFEEHIPYETAYNKRVPELLESLTKNMKQPPVIIWYMPIDKFESNSEIRAFAQDKLKTDLLDETCAVGFCGITTTGKPLYRKHAPRKTIEPAENITLMCVEFD